jgi:riboflavin biosynthesis pyrimidine reductase
MNAVETRSAPVVPLDRTALRVLTTPAPAPLRRLIAAPVAGGARRGDHMPTALRARYGGELVVPLRRDRPTIVANFVSTLDGVVAFDTAEASGGGEVSGFAEPDRFVMGLLRALADVVVVGAGTARAAPDHVWTADHVHRASAPAFARWREDLGLRPHPTTIVVSASGRVPERHPGLTRPSVPAVVLTTSAGADRVARSGLGSHVEVRIGSQPERVTPADLLGVTSSLGANLVLCEGGPHVLGQLIDAGVVDELFLTLAPQLAGRSGANPRLALIEGSAFDVSSAPWATLRSVHAAGSHLFLRYRFGSPQD